MTRLIVLGLAVLYLAFLGNVQGKRGVGDGEQDWGYETVRDGAHMFWWLYQTTNKDVDSYLDKPLVIWLQGGPGGSSTGYGNFEELGPYDINLNPRNYTWVKDYNVLFIDNPVGTGFSHADNTKSFARTNAQIATDLVDTMRGFYKKLPEFRKVPVYITSESYGGKMAAEFALVWYKAEKSGSIESNLRGVGLGDSWISPIDSVLTWAPFLLQTGMVDTNGYKAIEKAAFQTKAAVDAGKWEAATNLWAYTERVIIDATSDIDFYNILTKMEADARWKMEARYKRVDYRDANAITRAMLRATAIDDITLNKLMNTVVKKALNVSVTWGTQANSVFSYLSEDFMKPVTDVVERLLDETDLKVFVYTGQLDLIVDTPGTLLWVERLKWKNAIQWKISRRTPLVAGNIIEGYRKSYGNLGFYWVNRAGHMVPADNPAATAAILRDLTGQ